MVRQDHVRGLPLSDQRTDDPVDLVKFVLRQVDSFSGGSEQFLIVTLGSPGIISVLRMDRTLVRLFCAAVADKRSLFDAGTMPSDKVFADIVAAVTGPAFRIADDQLSAGIRFSAMIPMNAEVVGIVETSAVPGINDPVLPDLF